MAQGAPLLPAAQVPPRTSFAVPASPFQNGRLLVAMSFLFAVGVAAGIVGAPAILGLGAVFMHNNPGGFGWGGTVARWTCSC